MVIVFVDAYGGTAICGRRKIALVDVANVKTVMNAATSPLHPSRLDFGKGARHLFRNIHAVTVHRHSGLAVSLRPEFWFDKRTGSGLAVGSRGSMTSDGLFFVATSA